MLRRLRIGCCFFFYFFLIPSYAEQLLIEPDMGRAPLLKIINNTQTSLQLVMYGFTDEVLLKAILQQKARGKKVQVFLEQAPYKSAAENEKAFAALNAAHIPWQGNIPPWQLIHQKTLLIDDKEALVMTFNFTHSSFSKERNFALVLDNPTDIQAIRALFAADWEHQPVKENSSHLIISPYHSREKILHLIASANRTLDLYAQNFTDYRIVGAVAKAAKSGVRVRLLTSIPLAAKQAAYLLKSGVNIRYSKKLYIHAKIMLVDQKQVLLGSINFTRASLDKNRELSIISTNDKVVQHIQQTFNKDWQNTNDNDLPISFQFHQKEIKQLLHWMRKQLSSF